MRTARVQARQRTSGKPLRRVVIYFTRPAVAHQLQLDARRNGLSVSAFVAQLVTDKLAVDNAKGVTDV